MKNNKLSLVRETILPLAATDLAQINGGVRSNCIPQPSRITQPQPKPTLGATVSNMTQPNQSGWGGNAD